MAECSGGILDEHERENGVGRQEPAVDCSMKGEDMTRGSWFRLFLILPLCLAAGSCSRAADTGRPAEAALPPPAAEETAGGTVTLENVPEVWRPLVRQLEEDGIAGQEISWLFVRLGDELSQEPMGHKVRELYNVKYLPKPGSREQAPAVEGGDPIPKPWYKGVVTDANARRCRSFINMYAPAFHTAEETYGVPTEVAAALLFVETRLGDYLGDQNAFVTLASMAASRSPESIPDWMAALPDQAPEKLEWISRRMADKADWAYAELRHLLQYSLKNGVDPFEIPSSRYGAVGLCQFMPSSVARFAQDGNGDGIIDLFDPADAVASLSNYLALHGWKRDSTIPQKIKVLRRYNNLAIYANTILALSEKIREIPGRPAVNRPLPKPSAVVSQR